MVNLETSIHENEGCHNEDEKIIYLHLKRFFSGARFTNRPFLESIQSKYKYGDRVYISGKVICFLVFHAKLFIIYDFSHANENGIIMFSPPSLIIC